MIEFLVDTSVMSELAPDRAPPPGAFVDWLFAHEEELHLSVVTIAEIEQGIGRLRLADRLRKANALADWLARSLELFGPRVWPMSRDIAYETGRLGAKAIAIGRHPGLADVAIAATAQVHGFTVLTRNIRHFEPLGVAVRDPFASP